MATLQFFLGAQLFALSGGPNVRRRLQRATSLRTRANTQRVEIPLPPPRPPFSPRAATARFRRQPCCSSPLHRRSDSPAPPPDAISPRRRLETPLDLLPAFSSKPRTVVAMSSRLLSTWRSQDARRFARKVCTSASHHHLVSFFLLLASCSEVISYVYL
jgi:hypothetical protein